ncbi:MAG TPA: glycosyltransferase [Sphingomicrobium sp.]|nr:glycosyltransferase [Sphingomicrobium sp.]
MTGERYPRATFLLVTFNQAEFVAEAVNSALAQDYSNLQIIISDDSSTDETFEVARKSIEKHSGAHRILLRRTPRNLGLIAHLYESARLADGELIIVAAGDDISYAHRVSALMDAWQKKRSTALCSGWDICDQRGVIVSRDNFGGRSDLRFGAYFPGRKFIQIIGATAAYTPEVFDLVPQPSNDVFAEDLYFSLILRNLDRVITEVPLPLIQYRQHGNALTNRENKQSVAEYEQIVSRGSVRITKLLRAVQQTIFEMEQAPKNASETINHKALGEDIAFNEFRSGWIEGGPVKRIKAFLRFRDPSHRRWIGPRLFGLDAFVQIKKLVRRAS